MPLVKIETRRSSEPSEKLAICDAVHAAMMEALKIPESDRQIRYVEHAPENFQVPPGKTQNYTLLEITLFKGRTMEAKRNLYRGIVSNLGSLEIAPEDVFIVLIEVPPHLAHVLLEGIGAVPPRSDRVGEPEAEATIGAPRRAAGLDVLLELLLFGPALQPPQHPAGLPAELRVKPT